jgi:hypothetical protein
MAGWPKNENKTHYKIRNRLGNSSKRSKCLQINLQHSRPATDNLVKRMEEEDTGVVSILQPYNIGSTIGNTRTYTVILAEKRKKRTATIIISKQIDATLLTQISDENVTVVELRLERVTQVVAGMHFDIKQPPETQYIR